MLVKLKTKEQLINEGWRYDKGTSWFGEELLHPNYLIINLDMMKYLGESYEIAEVYPYLVIDDFKFSREVEDNASRELREVIQLKKVLPVWIS